jgi:hypothetical protein
MTDFADPSLAPQADVGSIGGVTLTGGPRKGYATRSGSVACPVCGSVVAEATLSEPVIVDNKREREAALIAAGFKLRFGGWSRRRGRRR